MNIHISVRLLALAIHLQHSAPPASRLADHIASAPAHGVAGLPKDD